MFVFSITDQQNLQLPCRILLLDFDSDGNTDKPG